MPENIDRQLVDQLHKNLEEHPQITRFLGTQLLLRVDASEDWLINPLLHDLATLPNQRRTELILQVLVNHLPNATHILESIFAEVICDDDGYIFDERLADAWAELYLLDYLLRHEFQEIVRPDTQKIRSSDFTASKDSTTYYAEAKRLRDQDDWILPKAFLHLQAARARHPELVTGSIILGRSDLQIDKLNAGDLPRSDGQEGETISQSLSRQLGPGGAETTLRAIQGSEPSELLLEDGYVTMRFTPTKDMFVIGSIISTSMDTLALEYLRLLGRILGTMSSALHQIAQFARVKGDDPDSLVFVSVDGTSTILAPHTQLWRNLSSALEKEVNNLSTNDPYGPKIPCTLVLHSQYETTEFSGSS